MIRNCYRLDRSNSFVRSEIMRINFHEQWRNNTEETILFVFAMRGKFFFSIFSSMKKKKIFLKLFLQKN